jgi:hypothetical protein
MANTLILKTPQKSFLRKSVMFLAASTAYVNSSVTLQGWYAACATHHIVTCNNISNIFVLKRQAFTIFPVSHQVLAGFSGFTSTSGNFQSLLHPKVRGLLTSGIFAAVILTATTSAAIALSHSINPAHFVDQVITNVTKVLSLQHHIDYQLMTGLDPVQAAVMWLGQ